MAKQNGPVHRHQWRAPPIQRTQQLAFCIPAVVAAAPDGIRQVKIYNQSIKNYNLNLEQYSKKDNARNYNQKIKTKKIYI